jgi:hypothetical protein
MEKNFNIDLRKRLIRIELNSSGLGWGAMADFHEYDN